MKHVVFIKPIFFTNIIIIISLLAEAAVVKVNLQETNPITNFIPASTPTNLMASVSIFDVEKKLLQLNISWVPNKEGQPANSYNIHVWASNKNDTACNTETYYGFIEDPESTSWIVSPQPLPQALHEYTPYVLPGCEYKIRVEANPHNGQKFAQIDFIVPDCVENICSCQHAKSLPQPDVRVHNIDKHTVNITWLSQPNPNITAFVVRAGRKMMEHSDQSVYDLSWSRHVTVVPSQHLYSELFTCDHEGRYAAAVRVVDNRQCLGPDQKLTFLIENETAGSQEDHFTIKKDFWKTLLPLGSFFIVCCLLGILFGQRYHNSSGFHNHSLFYTALKLQSERVFRRNNSLQQRNILYVEKELEEAKALGTVDNFEISFNSLVFEREIGRGTFGRVFLARVESCRSDKSKIVAVKTLQTMVSIEEREDFLEEIAMLKRIGTHPNIVSLLACCTLKTNICMVMEYVPCGDLLNYLRNLRQKLNARKDSIASTVSYGGISNSTVFTNLSQTYSLNVGSTRPDQTDCELDHKELHNFALQISRGMAHLEAKSITHRDLAARNILIDSNKVLKISDFGLSRIGIYVNSRRRKVPLRWLSIEAMRDALYSSKSDVWAFAIVMWEIGTLGGFPYPTVADYDLLEFLKNGNRLEKPEIASQDLYNLMLVCWSEVPEERPTFSELVSYLEPSPEHPPSVYMDPTLSAALPPTSGYVPMRNLSVTGQ